jgi:hypothetical protein
MTGYDKRGKIWGNAEIQGFAFSSGKIGPFA